MPSGTAPVAMERLRELAGPRLYQRNAFRLTGLPTTATRQAIRRRRQQIATAASAGVPIPATGELPVPGRRSAEQYSAAFDVIDHPQRRIVDELFWIWDVPNGGCGCDPALHEAHDSAVRAHIRVLDEELRDREVAAEGEPSWGVAAAGWRRALDHPGFWDHLRHRVTALDDHRLDAAAVPALEGEFRRALVTPLASLAVGATSPQRLTALFGAWSWAGERLLGAAVENRLRPVLETVESTLTRARELHTENPAGAAAIVEKEVLPQLNALLAFDTDGVRRPLTKLRDRTALLLNNCAISADGAAPLPPAEGARLLDLALELATQEDTRRVVRDNQKHVAESALLPALLAVHALLEKDQPRQAAAKLRQEVLPQLAELRASADREARAGARQLADRVAILLNNCALALDSDSSASAARTSAELLDEAMKLRGSRKTRKLIRKNRRQARLQARMGPYATAFEEAVSGLKRAQDLVRDHKPDLAAAEVERRVVPHAETLAGCRVRKLRRPAARLVDQTAILLNNCALAMAPVNTVGESSRLLQVALKVARKRKTRALIQKNRTAAIYMQPDYRLSMLSASDRQTLMRLPPDQQARFLAQLPDLW